MDINKPWPTREELAKEWDYAEQYQYPTNPSDPRLIPDAIYFGLEDYAKEHRPTGGFLQAVLENDLRMASLRADVQSMKAFKALAMFLSNAVELIPMRSHGSPKAYASWIKEGKL